MMSTRACNGRWPAIRSLAIYAKNEARSIPAHVLRQIREEIDG